MRLYIFVKTILLMVILLFFVPIKVMANEAAWQALQEGRAIAVMRHAIAPSGVDNSHLTRDVCKEERNLSQQGREQAKRIGDVFRANSIVDAKVYSSSLCRCVDTAELLGFDAPVLLPAINAYYPDRSKAPGQTAELKDWITQQLSQEDASNILVTHGFNVQDLTNRSVSQGEFLIISMEDNQVKTLFQASTD
ncbi:MAG: histidine phosphatase family protein [Acidiferrobacterales bacterium]|nr:histidine phosphatase family protein [Acidiferrobacterales bacterium]